MPGNSQEDIVRKLIESTRESGDILIPVAITGDLKKPYIKYMELVAALPGEKNNYLPPNKVIYHCKKASQQGWNEWCTEMTRTLKSILKKRDLH